MTRGSLRSIASSAPVIRQFCERCGSQITYANESGPETIDVTLATLDQPSKLVPVDHLWMEDAPSWDRPADGLPHHQRGRPL